MAKKIDFPIVVLCHYNYAASTPSLESSPFLHHTSSPSFSFFSFPWGPLQNPDPRSQQGLANNILNGGTGGPAKPLSADILDNFDWWNIIIYATP